MATLTLVLFDKSGARLREIGWPTTHSPREYNMQPDPRPGVLLNPPPPSPDDPPSRVFRRGEQLRGQPGAIAYFEE